jgi:hypothetical protein
MEPVLQLAANSNIPVYTIDSRGLYTSPYFDAGQQDDIGVLFGGEVEGRNGNGVCARRPG